MIKVITEKWDNSINKYFDSKYSKYTMSNFKNVLQQNGVDIENNDFVMTQIKNARDSIWSENCILIFCIKYHGLKLQYYNYAGSSRTFSGKTRSDDEHYEVIAFKSGNPIYSHHIEMSRDDTWDNFIGDSGDLPKKVLISQAEAIYKIELDDEITSDLANKRKQRAIAKNGIVDRRGEFDVRQKDSYYDKFYDKSGYKLTDPNKYKNMLTDMKVNDSSMRIISKAQEVYGKLAQSMMQRGSYTINISKLNNVKDCMDKISSLFRRLDYALDDYSRVGTTLGNGFVNGVYNAIEDLDESIKDANELLEK